MLGTLTLFAVLLASAVVGRAVLPGATWIPVAFATTVLARLLLF